ncbi:hypothetical protein [Methylobacterium sp. A54F]
MKHNPICVWTRWFAWHPVRAEYLLSSTRDAAPIQAAHLHVGRHWAAFCFIDRARTARGWIYRRPIREMTEDEFNDRQW